MNLSDFRSIYEIFDREECDTILYDLCRGILEGQRRNPEYYGLVAACVLGPNGERVYSNNHALPNGQRVHAERAALTAYTESFGRVPKDAIIITTLSPCSADMSERFGLSCTQLIQDYEIQKVYCGYEDPTQSESEAYHTKRFTVLATEDDRLRAICKQFAEIFLGPQLNENFADGKVKGKSRPGRVKKAGASCSGSVTDLRSKAKNSSGERAKMYHWCANMKSGKKKKTNEVINHPGIKTKTQDKSGLVNKGEPVPAGKEQKLLGTKVGKLGAYEVYRWDEGNDSAYSVFDPKTRVSQMTVSGRNKAHSFEIFGIYGGPQSPVRAADLYAWLVKSLGLTLVSDKYQSPGGQRVWQELEQRFGRSVNVYAYNMKTNEPINTGADDPESTHGTRGDVAQNVRLVAAPK
jgi:pyrimidine deaminase RibD-like protein